MEIRMIPSVFKMRDKNNECHNLVKVRVFWAVDNILWRSVALY